MADTLDAHHIHGASDIYIHNGIEQSYIDIKYINAYVKICLQGKELGRTRQGRSVCPGVRQVSCKTKNGCILHFC